MDEDFAAMWRNEESGGGGPGGGAPVNAAGAPELSPAELNEETPEYRIRDGIARYELLCSILAHYYHAKHGEPMGDTLAPRDIDFLIRGGGENKE